jgi:hypothetical protein
LEKVQIGEVQNDREQTVSPAQRPNEVFEKLSGSPEVEMENRTALIQMMVDLKEQEQTLKVAQIVDQSLEKVVHRYQIGQLEVGLELHKLCG